MVAGPLVNEQRVCVCQGEKGVGRICITPDPQLLVRVDRRESRDTSSVRRSRRGVRERVKKIDERRSVAGERRPTKRRRASVLPPFVFLWRPYVTLNNGTRRILKTVDDLHLLPW